MSDGVSLNQSIAAAVAKKVGSLRTAREFLRERAGMVQPTNMLKYLRRAPKVPPAAEEQVSRHPSAGHWLAMAAQSVSVPRARRP